MNKSLSQEQFGKNAAHYLTSTPHATGKSLQRLVDLTSPQKSWRVLDIATGGGHVAYGIHKHRVGMAADPHGAGQGAAVRSHDRGLARGINLGQ